MGFERVALFGAIELDIQATLPGAVKLKTDLPGNALIERENHPAPACSRRVVRLRLSGTTKGHLYQVNYTTPGQTTIYGARIRARLLPEGAWDWYAIPIPGTSAEWTAVPLAIPPMGDWERVPLAIAPPGDWERVPLAIAPPGDWERVELPIQPTPEQPGWVNVPVDA